MVYLLKSSIHIEHINLQSFQQRISKRIEIDILLVHWIPQIRRSRKKKASQLSCLETQFCDLSTSLIFIMQEQREDMGMEQEVRS